MNYTELVTAIQNTCVNTEAQFNNHINDFIIATEDKIFQGVSGPLFWKASSSTPTVAGTREYVLAGGTIDVLGIRICETPSGDIDTGGQSRYLLRKDIDFLREAYPGPTTGTGGGIPKYYSVSSAGVSGSDPTLSVQMAPVPDDVYNFQAEYYGKAVADSITNGSTPDLPLATSTWISVAFPDVLLWGSVLQGYTFMKGEADVMAYYESRFNEGLLLLKNTSENRQGTDTFSDQGQGQ